MKPEAADLILVDRLRAQIAKCKSVPDLLDLRDKAEAIRMYQRQHSARHQAQNRAAEAKLWIERRLGEVLGEMPDKGTHGGDRKSSPTMGLEELGLTKNESSRYQQIASIPLDQFSAYIGESKDLGNRELTQAGALKLARKLRAGEEVGSSEVIHEDRTARLEDFVESGVKFGCIYADPPWAYGNQATRASTDNHYPTMSVADISAIPVSELVDDSAHLHLWTTNAFLFEAKSVMESWGFEYKSAMVWVKPQMGIGNYWRVSHEFLLLGIRGRAPFPDGCRNIRSWIEAKRTEHSKKPEAFRDLIERVSPGPYLEMFGRSIVPGWSSFGNQIDIPTNNAEAA